MELPSYHLPTLKGLALHTWERLKGFILKAGKIIVPMVLVLNLLSNLGTDGSFCHQEDDQSVLAAVGQGIIPVFAPIGLKEDNWPAAVGVFTGILAKEAVVGTLDTLYSRHAAAQLAEQAPADQAEVATTAAAETSFDLVAAVGEAFATPSPPTWPAWPMPPWTPWG